MVTAEDNRTQTGVKPPFERQTQAFRPAPEAGVEERKVEQREPIRFREPMLNTGWIVSLATMSASWGLGALTLGILGLVGVAPAYLLPVAGIVLGAALVALACIGWPRARMFEYAEKDSRRDRLMFFGGTVGTLIAGLGGIVLGILNLGLFNGVTFGSIAVIVLGAGLLWHSRVMAHLRRFTVRSIEGMRHEYPFTVNSTRVAPVRDFIVGFGSVVLGILAVIGLAPVVLGFVALMAMGLAVAGTSTTACAATLSTLEAACPEKK